MTEEERKTLKARMKALLNIKLDFKTDDELKEYETILLKIASTISLKNEEVENIMEGVRGQYYFSKSKFIE